MSPALTIPAKIIRELNKPINELGNNEGPVRWLAPLGMTEQVLHVLDDLSMNTRVIRAYRYLNGLEWTRWNILNAQVQILEGLKKELAKHSPETRVPIQKELEKLLARKPGFYAEYPKVREAWLDLVPATTGSTIPLHVAINMLNRTKQNNLSPLEAADLLVQLTDSQMLDTADTLLAARGREILTETFSSRNPDAHRAERVAQALQLIRTKSTRFPKSLASRWIQDSAEVIHGLVSPQKPLLENLSRWALESGLPRQTLPIPGARKFGISAWTSLKHPQDLQRRAQLRTYMDLQFNSARELKDWVQQELRPRKVLVKEFSRDFASTLARHPEWFQGAEDFDAVLAEEAFWPALNLSRVDPTSLEGAMLPLLHSRAEKFPESWRWEPAASERLQRQLYARAYELGLAPLTPGEKFEWWKKLTARGVTTLTDQLFSELHSELTGAEKKDLEDLALNGRIWEQEARASIAQQRIRQSSDYLSLRRENALEAGEGPATRQAQLKHLIDEVQKLLPERGNAYTDLLEELSREIKSTPRESELIHAAKGATTGERSEDAGLRAFSELMERVHEWKRSEQWDFVRFLRGDIAPTPHIQASFASTGTERVQRMYSLLPPLARAGILDAFLDYPSGLLPSKADINKGYGRTILRHLLANAEPESRRIAEEVLQGFLYSLDQSGNPALRSFVLAYLLALPPSATGSAGETLRSVLEIFGATGVKLGQLLLASEILPPKEAIHLRSLQEQARIPDRQRIHEDLSEIAGGLQLPLAIDDLLGAASIKYAIKAFDLATQKPLVLKVLRLDAIAHTNTEFNQFEAMAKYLTKTHGSRYGIFQSIVKASRQAVERELSAADEVRKGRVAGKLYADKMTDSESARAVSFLAPRELLVDSVPQARLIAAQFAAGTSIFKLDPGLARLAAQAILERERELLFPSGSDAEKPIVFDPDRHAGNYRIQPLRDERLAIHPIDFGQLSVLSRKEARQLVDLFALAQIMKQAGPAASLVQEIARSLELSPAAIKKLGAALGRYFPDEGLREAAAYQSVLTALDNIGEGRSTVFFDFVRGIVQLQQYESLLDPGAKVHTPREELTRRVQARADAYVAQLHLTLRDKVRVGIYRGKLDLRKRFVEGQKRCIYNLQKLSWSLQGFPGF